MSDVIVNITNALVKAAGSQAAARDAINTAENDIKVANDTLSKVRMIIRSLRRCCKGRFATTIFSASQRCNIATILFLFVTTLFQHCCLKNRRWKSPRVTFKPPRSRRQHECQKTIGLLNKITTLSSTFHPLHDYDVKLSYRGIWWKYAARASGSWLSCTGLPFIIG